MLPKSEFAILCVTVLVFLCHASPINRQAGGQNTLRLDVRNQSYTEQNVCVNDDVLYQPGDLMPAPNPCSRCVCNPPGSQCTPVACEKKPGCKALLRPNQCCPEYQCECERNGRLYQNGERLDNAENPCEACYCQGGEVVCTTVECYKRDDCEPQFVTGKCCPKYDHCPPLVMDDARFSDQSAAEKARPHHTRSTFQPDVTVGTVGADAIDQAIDASNVQERVHVPDTTVSTETVNVATSTPVADPAQEHAQEPAHDQKIKDEPVTDAPQPSQQDDAERVVPTIKIEVPAIPWTESPKDSTDKPQSFIQTDQHEGSGDEAETQTIAANDDQGSGMPETEAPMIKTQDEGLIGVIEHITEAVQRDAGTVPSSTDQISIELTTIVQDEIPVVTLINEEAKKEENEEGSTSERALDVTEATDADTDPTTLSSEFTDTPDEMKTTEEPALDDKDVTEMRGVDLATEALLDATTVVKDNAHSMESSTDSSPEFKDFDEWTGTKSSEFQRDSSSTGSSSSPSSSSSDSHSKQTGSSDESTSHFLATNINSEKVKLASESGPNSALGSSSQNSGVSSTDSEESDSTEGSATTEISDSENSDSTQKILEDKQEIYSPQKSELDGSVLEQKITSLSKNEEKTKVEQKQDGQLNIVLDTEATDDNGPPILLIGDELANHQMDIVVATVPTHVPEPVTDVPSEGKLEIRTAQKGSSDKQKANPELPIETTTLDQFYGTVSAQDLSNKNGVQDIETESQTEDIFSESTTNNNADVTESVAITTSSETKDFASSPEKIQPHAAQEEIMLSDDPLPGQAPSEDNTNQENLDQVLGKTQKEIKKDKESQKPAEIMDDSQGTTVLTTLQVGDTTETSVEMRTAELQTESPERESTTNTAGREDMGTTEEPHFETTSINNDDAVTMELKAKGTIEDQVSDRRSDILDDVTTEIATDIPSTSNNQQSGSTVIYDNTERGIVDGNEPNIFDKSSTINEEKSQQEVGLRSKPSEFKGKDTDVNQSPENPPDDVTASSEDITTQNPILSKADKVKDFAHEEMLLGDQPQTVDSSIYLQSENDKNDEEKKKEEDQNNDDLVEDKTEMNLESAIIHEEIHFSEADQESEGTQKIEDQSTVEKADSEHIEVTEKISEIPVTTEAQERTDSDKGEIIRDEEQETGNLAQTSQDLEKSVQKTDIGEQGTLPPDAAITDENEGLKVTTNPPGIVVKTVQEKDDVYQTTESAPEATTLGAITEQQTDTVRNQDTAENVPKINPEVLELKPIVPTPASNATEIAHEADVTTLPPQWLKNENETKLGESQQTEKTEGQIASTIEITTGVAGETTVLPTEVAKDSIDDVTTAQTPTVDAGEQRLDEKKGVEDADKKDLFILEDFFTKLYRHQIATDATKH